MQYILYIGHWTLDTKLQTLELVNRGRDNVMSTWAISRNRSSCAHCVLGAFFALILGALLEGSNQLDRIHVVLRPREQPAWRSASERASVDVSSSRYVNIYYLLGLLSTSM